VAILCQGGGLKIVAACEQFIVREALALPPAGLKSRAD
jgi:hypothetical protein